MPQCENCDGYVTERFVRVFGDNEGRVFGCLDCIGATAVKNGAALPFRDARTHLGGAD
ncbi:hypothetical protein G9464_20710 [Halostella sp. JP-L12]|uniref:DUF7563 family protein n=1 Tax=Halostella TaxID=1843185 RepID=UPI0013CE6D84|nr:MULTISPECIES: hypothetical protein [Halostella]NHN49994.1 hypothetical protein [Halostella sp. JP-L12]